MHVTKHLNIGNEYYNLATLTICRKLNIFVWLKQNPNVKVWSE